MCLRCHKNSHQQIYLLHLLRCVFVCVYLSVRVERQLPLKNANRELMAEMLYVRVRPPTTVDRCEFVIFVLFLVSEIFVYVSMYIVHPQHRTRIRIGHQGYGICHARTYSCDERLYDRRPNTHRHTTTTTTISDNDHSIDPTIGNSHFDDFENIFIVCVVAIWCNS